jgi:hypothetical protein
MIDVRASDGDPRWCDQQQRNPELVGEERNEKVVPTESFSDAPSECRSMQLEPNFR